MVFIGKTCIHSKEIAIWFFLPPSFEIYSSSSDKGPSRWQMVIGAPSKGSAIWYDFPKMAVVVNKRLLISFCCREVALTWRGWYFNICLPFREQKQRGTLVSHIPASVTLSFMMFTIKEKGEKRPCVFVSAYRVRDTCQFFISLFSFFTSLFDFFLHGSFRNAHDPEVSVQLQCQLHWPPHLSVHAVSAEDGAGTPEPPAGQPGCYWDQHRYMRGNVWGDECEVTKKNYINT